MAEAFDPYWEWLQIQPHEHPPHYYRLLGLAPLESDRALIEAAADERQSLVRSFKRGPHAAQARELLAELKAAQKCLLDPRTKSSYDAVLQARLAATGGIVAPPLPPLTPYPEAAYSQPPMAQAAPPVQQQQSAVPMAHAVTSIPQRSDAEDPSLVRRRRIIVVLIAVVVAGALVGGGIWFSRRGAAPVAEGPQPTSSSSAEESPDAAELPPEEPPPDQQEPPSVVINQEGSGEVFLPASLARIHGSTPQLENRDGGEVITNWTDERDSLSWDFRLVKLPRQGAFRVQVTYAVTQAAADGRFEVSIGESATARSVNRSATPGDFVTDDLHLIVRSTGQHRLTMRLLEKPGGELLTLKSIRLVPR